MNNFGSNAPDIVDLVAAGRRRAELEQQRWETEQRERQRQEAERRRRDARTASRVDLLAIVDEWSLANRIETFFRDVQSHAEASNDGVERESILGKVRRARELLGGIDALVRLRGWKSPDEIDPAS